MSSTALPIDYLTEVIMPASRQGHRSTLRPLADEKVLICQPMPGERPRVMVVYQGAGSGIAKVRTLILERDGAGLYAITADSTLSHKREYVSRKGTVTSLLHTISR